MVEKRRLWCLVIDPSPEPPLADPVLEVQAVVEKRRLWCLVIVWGIPAGEPVSIACDDEQGNPFYSAGPQRNLY